MRLARNACTTVLIVDAQSVKNTDTAALEGDAAGKKLCGIKRHTVVDRQGFPHAVAVTTAEVTDHKGALQAMNRCKANLGKGQSALADSGSMGQPFAQAVKEALGEEVTVQIAKRWVVERSFSWMDKNRWLGKNGERKLDTSLQFIHLAFLALLLRKV
jgi:transposase